MKAPRASWASLDVARLLAVAFAVVFTWWAYRDFTSSFFIFDDFWVLEVADRIYRSGDWLDIFVPPHNFLQYRPFTTVGWFTLQRALWGLKPAGYYHVQLAVLALNVVLAFAIGRRLLGSAVAGLAVAIIYATAPGHAMSARWLSQIIVAASVTVYFTGLLLWLRPSPWRGAYATVVLVIGLLTSEHTVTLPMAWTVLVLLGPERWTRAAAFRALGVPWAVAISYIAAKLWYAKVLRETRPFYAQIVLKGYAVDLTPDVLLPAIGRYVANALDLLYGWAGDPAATARLGLGLVVTAVIAGVVVLFRRDVPRALRVAAVGLALFLVGLGPVGLMPGHFSACYVGIAALGTALAVVGTACAVPALGRSLALVVAGACLAFYVQQVHAAIRRDFEIRLMDGMAQNAVRWLYTLERRTAAGDVREVLVPNEGQNDRLFGAAHRLFLCAPYEVRAVPPAELQPAPGRLVLRTPDRAPADRLDGAWLPRPCPSAPADPSNISGDPVSAGY